MNSLFFHGTGRLWKSSVRQNRVLMLLIALLPFLTAFGVAYSNLAVLQEPAALQNYILQNQGNLLLGNIAGNTIEAASIWRVRTSAAVLVFLLNIVLVIRSTRKDEDLGRLELIRSGAIGSLAPLSAVMLNVYVANLLGGAGIAAAFLLVSFPVRGSILAGLTIALASCTVATAAAVFAQFAADARMARGLSFGITAVFLILTVAANASGIRPLLLLSPFGWCAFAEPFAKESPMILLIGAASVLLLFAAACFLLRRRDVGGGLIPARKGHPTGRFLHTPFALAFRLQRGMLLVWLCAYLLMGLVIGSLSPGINDMLRDTGFLPELSALLGGSGNAFLAILSYILTQVITAYSLMAVLRCREEELQNRSEFVLSTPVSRIHYMLGHLLTAYLGSALAIFLFGITAGNPLGCLSGIPAVWAVTSLAVLLFGFLPRYAAAASWSVFGILIILEFLWEMRFINAAVFRLSPFSWVYPGTPVSLFSLLFMLAAGLLLTLAGLAGWRRRDVPE